MRLTCWKIDAVFEENDTLVVTVRYLKENSDSTATKTGLNLPAKIASINRRASDGSHRRGPSTKLVEVAKIGNAALNSLLFII
jgi:hypothetical protein